MIFVKKMMFFVNTGKTLVNPESGFNYKAC